MPRLPSLLTCGISFVLIVSIDRFHFQTHKTRSCRIENNPSDTRNDILWDSSREGRAPVFRFNSSASECTNAWAEGLGKVISGMHSVYNEFVFDMAAVTHNEMLAGRKLMDRDATYAFNDTNLTGNSCRGGI